MLIPALAFPNKFLQSKKSAYPRSTYKWLTPYVAVKIAKIPLRSVAAILAATLKAVLSALFFATPAHSPDHYP
jgi:hypothetical protein